MGRLRQFYDGVGVPLMVDRASDAPARAWQSHRARLRAWLDSTPESEWNGPTRCELWDMTGLVRHLISGSQFLGYTLHKASAGTATKLMSGFDTHATVQADAARFGDLTPDAASGLLTSKDASVDIEIEAVAAHGWSVMAEAPPGRVPAHLAVNHFLLDSWVHEYDLMLPLGQRPVIDDLEAETVVGYVVALASVQTGTATPLDLRLHDPDLHVGLEITDNTAHVTVGSVPKHAPVIEGRVADVVDRATGRNGGPIHGDPLALEVLDGFAALLVR